MNIVCKLFSEAFHFFCYLSLFYGTASLSVTLRLEKRKRTGKWTRASVPPTLLTVVLSSKHQRAFLGVIAYVVPFSRCIKWTTTHHSCICQQRVQLFLLYPLIWSPKPRIRGSLPVSVLTLTIRIFKGGQCSSMRSDADASVLVVGGWKSLVPTIKL